MSVEKQNLVTASVCPFPFRTASERVAIPEGCTVTQAMGQFAPLGVLHHAHVFVDGEPVSRDEWGTTVLWAGQQVDIRVVPTGGGGGGGKDPLKTVLALAVMAGSLAIGNAAGWWAGAQWALSSTMRGAVGFGVSGILGTGGFYALSKMLPPPTIPEQKQENPVYSITGQQNRANPYGAVPKVYGKMRVFPPLAAMPYTEAAGHDQYLRILFTPGYGPLKLSDFKIGDEDAENYDTEICYCEGHAACTDCDQYTAGQTICAAGWVTDGTPVSSDKIYSDTIYEKQIEEELEYVSGAGWKHHDSHAGADADAISVDVAFPSGLCGFNDDGVRVSASNTLEMRYMKKSLYEASGTDWLPSTDPTVEELCPDFDDWTAGGGATYSADVDGSGNPGFTLDADGEYAESPFIKIYYPSEFDFLADYYSDNASPEYTVECEYYRSAYSHARPIENTDGETATEIDGGFTQSTWDEETETFKGGGDIRYVKVKIKYNADTPDTYKVRLPRIVTYMQWTITASTTRPFRKTYSWDIADPSEYVVQVRRADAEGGGDSLETMYWSTLRTIVCDNPVSFSGDLAQVAMRIKATGALSGTVDRFSVLASSILPVYSGSWTPTETGNPAWCFCDALRSDANANAVAASRIDLTAMTAWASHVSNKSFNGIIDKQMPLYEVLKTIASVGRGSPTMLDGDYSVVEDIESAIIVQHFTPRNSFGFKGSKSFVEIPHGLKLKFFNENEDFVQDETIYYHPDYTAATATKFQTLTLMGITDPDQAYEEGRYHMAAMILRPEIFTLQTDIEHIVCTRGDRVKVTHDVPLIGLGFGRFAAVTDLGSNVYEYELDSAVTMITGSNYVIRPRYDDGTTGFISVVNVNDTVTTVTDLAGWVGTRPAIGDLFQFGIRGYEALDMMVQSIRPGPDMSATLALVEYNSSVYSTGDIPAHESNITVQPEPHRTPPVPIIESVASDEYAMYEIAPGVYESQILLTLLRVSTAAIMPHDIHVQYRETDSGEDWRRLAVQPAAEAKVSVRPVEDGISYDVRLRYVSEYGRASEWKYENNYEVIGKSTVPDDITTMVYQPSGKLEWEYTPPRDFLGFKVRYNDGSNTAWDQGTPAHGGYLTVTVFDISGFAAGTTTWLVKAFDTADNESANPAYVIKDIGDPVTENIVQTIDYDAEGYPGSLDDCTVTTGDLYADEEAALFYGDPDSEFYDRGTLFYSSFYKSMTYETPFYPYVATTVGSDLWLDYTATGIADIYYRTSEVVHADDFTGTLLDTWTEDNDGTWAIASEELTAIHDSVGEANQTVTWDETFAPDGEKSYLFARVKSADVSDATFGVQVRGAYYLWNRTKHTKSHEGDTTDNPTMTDDTWEAWLFEVLADDTVNWYVDGALIDSGTANTTSEVVRLVLQADAVGPTTSYFDDIMVWEPSAGWIIWPGKIRTDDDELYEIRFRSLMGGTRGIITTLSTNLDAEDIIEYHNDFACAVTTGTRLTLQKTYTSIQNISITVQTSGAETAITAKADDKQNTQGATNGPLIMCYDAAGDVVAGHVDVRVAGY